MKGFKTVLFNLLMAAAVITGAAIEPEQITAFAEAIAVAWAAGGVLIRAFTNSPVFKKGDTPDA